MNSERIREVASSAYELLGLEFGAREEEIRRAHKAMSARFSVDGLAVYGLYSREETLGLLQLIDEAALILLNPERRQAYDRDLFPPGQPMPPPSTPPRAQNYSARVRPLIPPSETTELSAQPLSGSALRALRVKRGVSLKEVHSQTRISIPTLEAIEEERFASLPARVYLKGFLEQLALTLSLDRNQLLGDYLPRFEAWIDEARRAERRRRR